MAAKIFVIFFMLLSITVFVWKILPNTRDIDEDKVQEDFCKEWSKQDNKER